ncbi:hypothetical protein ACFQU9_03185 [Actinomadura namibiensis]|uniref:Uncharacterized protein n=1 Tax=Actinomadura namibiensis TaxID=182080 RepID=A0A7W3QRE2_ACTNM|nr:hypothetical protein [Actinomadura namibiensis]MBA8956606.1 hypothetical protein [Actinomadura namibiensis]
MEHERGVGVGDGGRAKRPPSLDELGIDVDEAEEVDVLAVAGGGERQQLVGDAAALGAQLDDGCALDR